MQLVFDFPINPHYSFENFIVCAGNRTAFEFARILAVGGGINNLLYIFGPAGCGKTHLLTALGAEIHRTAQLDKVPYVSFGELDGIYGGEYPAEEVSRLGERFKDSPVLLIDDIHLIPDNRNLRVEIWSLFNEFHSTGRRIAITGLYPPKELPHIDEHLVSRLLWGLVAGMDVSDDDSRRLVMKKLAEDRQVLLPADVIDYLLLHVRRDIPSLMDALEEINRFALAAGRKITVRLAREALAAENTRP